MHFSPEEILTTEPVKCHTGVFHALICAMEIQKIHMAVHIFSGFALFTESECIAELNPSASC